MIVASVQEKRLLARLQSLSLGFSHREAGGSETLRKCLDQPHA